MAAMSLASSVKQHAHQVVQRLQASEQPAGGDGGGLSGWINSLLSHINGNILEPVGSFVKTAVDWAFVARYWVHHARRGIGNAIAWLENGQLKWIVGYINTRANTLGAMIRLQHYEFVRRLHAAVNMLRGYAYALFYAERVTRRRADDRLMADYRTRIKWLHQNIEHEAASAYRAGQADRFDVITRLAGLVARLAPVTRFLVRELTRIVLDLLVVDNPVARILLGFVIKHIIARLGIEKPAGELLSRLLSSVTTGGRPKGLSDVIGDMSARLTALESQWADFMDHGGSEVEQAGDQWQHITGLATDAALLGLVTTMAVAPHTFARDLAGTVGTGLNDTIGAVARLIEKR
jgi:hypothetical protein